jgi:hypothetical protein
MKNAIALSLVLLFGLTLSFGQSTLPPNNYAYVVVTYSCQGKNVAVFSQVFGACYQETNHAQIAISERVFFDQVAAAACGGTPAFNGQNTSYPYQGPRAQDSANTDRAKAIRDYIGYGYRVESAYLQTPYSSRCRD